MFFVPVIILSTLNFPPPTTRAIREVTIVTMGSGNGGTKGTSVKPPGKFPGSKPAIVNVATIAGAMVAIPKNPPTRVNNPDSSKIPASSSVADAAHTFSFTIGKPAAVMMLAKCCGSPKCLRLKKSQNPTGNQSRYNWKRHVRCLLNFIHPNFPPLGFELCVVLWLSDFYDVRMDKHSSQFRITSDFLIDPIWDTDI